MNRQLAIQKIRKQLQSRLPSIGSWMQIPHPSVAEIMGQAGYDWVAVDMEHGSISHAQLPDLFRALELGETLPLVRLVEGTTKECKQALDAGAGGVIVPMVETAAQLIGVRDACRWPPTGIRGVGFSRANLFGKHFEEYQDEAQAPLLVAMIEHRRAVDELEAILDVEGLDAILIGPYDLSASIGLTAQFDHPEFCATMDKIKALTAAKSIPAGVHVVAPEPNQLQQRIEEGYRFLAYSIDAVMLQAVVYPGIMK
jgi:2-dehydro-3-deoxyglucarate aldolase